MKVILGRFTPTPEQTIIPGHHQVCWESMYVAVCTSQIVIVSADSEVHPYSSPSSD